MVTQQNLLQAPAFCHPHVEAWWFAPSAAIFQLFLELSLGGGTFTPHTSLTIVTLLHGNFKISLFHMTGVCVSIMCTQVHEEARRGRLFPGKWILGGLWAAQRSAGTWIGISSRAQGPLSLGHLYSPLWQCTDSNHVTRWGQSCL